MFGAMIHNSQQNIFVSIFLFRVAVGVNCLIILGMIAFYNLLVLHMSSVTQKLILQSGLIPGLRPANKRRRYKVTPSLIGSAQTSNQPCAIIIYNVHA